MKILICNKFFFPFGGTERYLFDLRTGLSALGYTVIDFSTKHISNIHSTYSDFFVSNIDLSKISFLSFAHNLNLAINFIYSFEAKNNIEQLIDKYRPDVAHLHNIYHHLSTSILNVLRRKRIPVVMTLHDYKLICPNYSLFVNNSPCEKCKKERYFNAIMHRCLKDSYLASFLACIEMYFCKIFKIYEKNVDLFIAPSIFLKNKMIEFGIDPNRIHYLPHAINLEFFTPNFKIGKYILYFGNISSRKGVETLIRSAKNIKVPIKIVGDGPDRMKLEAFVRKNHLINIDFLGYRSIQELANFIRDALFVVVPSKWYEVAGLNIYESFASGKCVIGANIGAIPELIEDRYTGLLFSPGDYEDLLEKMLYLIDNPLYLKEWGRNAYEKIHKLNNRTAHYQELVNIYKNLIAKYH